MNLYINNGQGKYTKELLSKACRRDFAQPKFALEDLDEKIVSVRDSLSSANGTYYKKLWEQFSARKYSTLSFKEKMKLQKERSQLRVLQKEYSSLLSASKGGTDKSLIKVYCSKKTIAYNNFQA
jgi:hypothetical protein